MKNESKAFKVGKLQKEEKLCFHLIDVGFLILSPLLSLLLVLADIKQHCLVLIWVSWKNKKLERVCVCVCVTFIKWTHTKRTWKGVEFSARVSFPGLPTHLLKTAVPGTITFLSGRLHGYPHALLSGDPVGSSHPLQAAKNGLHRLRHRTAQPAAGSCPLRCSPCLLTGLAMGSRRETWSAQWETTARFQQPVCWDWDLGRAGCGRFPEEKQSQNGKRGGSEVRKRSRERRMLKRKPCRRLKEATHQHKLTPSQNCLKSSGSSWRLPVLIAL